VDVVPSREPLDQPEEGGDDALGPALVHTAGRDDGDLHARAIIIVA
jgi:hypothetical protein